MKGYKGFCKQHDGTLMCRDFIYEPGKTYTIDVDVLINEQGFHACHELWQVWPYYPNDGSNEFWEVECDGQIMEDYNESGKFVCSEITLLKKIEIHDAHVFTTVWSIHNDILRVYNSRTQKCTIIDKNGKSLLNEEADEIDFFRHGFAVVTINKKKNFVNEKGEYLLDEWYDFVNSFVDERAIVCKNEKYNIVDTNGKIILERWLDHIDFFSEGLAKFLLFRKDGKPVVSFIDKDGNMPIKKWFDSADCFKEGFCKVYIDGKSNIIDKNGDTISDRWFKDACRFHNGLATVGNENGKMNYIKKDGTLLLEEWVDLALDFMFNKNYSLIQKDGSYYIIDRNGNIMFKSTYDNITLFENICVARKDDKCFILKYDGDRFIDESFDMIDRSFLNEISTNHILVRKDSKYNFVTRDGNFLSDMWLEYAARFSGDFALVKLNGKFNYLCKNGKFLSNKGFERAYGFVCGQFGYVSNGPNKYWIDKEGKLHLLKK